jgi:two-component system nitrate/nitrite response regulator NarL
VADGLTAPEIGHRLHLAPTTVRTHVKHLFEKVGSRDRAQLVRHAMRLGLLD